MFGSYMQLLWKSSLSIFMFLTFEVSAFGFSHQLISNSRSDYYSYVHVEQSIEGEYGSINHISQDGSESLLYWKGHGFRNGIGVEVMKFIQFNAYHTFSSLHAKDEGTTRMVGSRLNGELKLIFAAPVANLEAAGGVVASNMDYYQGLEHTGMVGSGMYYSIGMNYFSSPQISIFGHMRQTKENLTRGGGSKVIKELDTDMTSLGFGVSIWL
jgi:hypothetical protein